MHQAGLALLVSDRINRERLSHVLILDCDDSFRWHDTLRWHEMIVAMEIAGMEIFGWVLITY